MNKIIGFDPGISGGISVIDKDIIVYSMPIIRIKKGKKTKNTYDVVEIVKIVKKHYTDGTHFAIELVSTRPGEGGVSAFNFGKGFGELIGICTFASGIAPFLIFPATWKKHFPDLINSSIKIYRKCKEKIKEDIKSLTKQYNQTKTKEKTLKKKYKEEIVKLKKDVAKIDRDIKKEAKAQSRRICQYRYPHLADEFKLVKDDGKSDALLIGLYTRDNFNDLVSKNG